MHESEISHGGKGESQFHLPVAPASDASSDAIVDMRVPWQIAHANDSGPIGPPTSAFIDAPQDDEDDVSESSLDSFPASDPPAWTGLHIGGPARRLPRSTAAQQVPTDDGRIPAAPAREPFYRTWLARHWSGVHVSLVELLADDERGGAARRMVRAVVQLGALTPADVRVAVRRTVPEVERATTELLRLVSARSYHNGAVVFEAAGDANTLDGKTDLVVTVEPARERVGDSQLPSVLRLVCTTERAGCA
jgi:hypothetical protein